MNDIMGNIFMFIAGGTLHAVALYNSTRGMIKQIGRNIRFYPKHYTTVPKHFKKLFKITQHKIPKFFCYQYYLVILFALLGPIEFLLSLYSMQIAMRVLAFHYYSAILNYIVFIPVSAIFKKMK